MFSRYKKAIIIACAFFLIALVWVSLSFLDHSSGEEPLWGVHFSPAQARYLGLDWKETYRAILDDLDVDAVRLAALWNEIEIEPGVYDFSELDYLINEAARRDKRIILAVGRRLPRWPECHEPEWHAGKSYAETEEDVLALVAAIIVRYRDIEQIAMWQVENEPFLTAFGECPEPNGDVLRREIDLVRTLDDRPILTTDSGELSFWRKTAPLGDYFGTTLYRIVWNDMVGYFQYDYILPPIVYRMKAALVGKPIDRVLVAELQAEPWAKNGHADWKDGGYTASMSVEQLRANIDFARRTGIQEQYLWGAEAWLYLKEKEGDSSLWNEAKRLWTNAP